MTVKIIYQAALRWGIPAACILIIVAMVAGCVNFSPAKAGNSSSSNGGSGGGSSGSSAGSEGGGSGGGGGGPNSVVADKDNMKVSFVVDCSLTRVEKQQGGTTINIVKLKGDVPFLMSRSWDKKPFIDNYQVYPAGPHPEAKLNLYSEVDQQCPPNTCIPCHFVYEGPVWIDASVQHNAGDAAADWTGMIIPIATETTNHLSGHQLTQYVTNKEPACPVTADEAASMLVTYTESCFLQKDGSSGWAPVSFGDGSAITFFPADSETQLDSTAVFHISG
jgi:hypothetical protein